METNGLRRLLRHEGALSIPPQHNLTLRCIPHECQRIELTVQRALLVDAAGTALTLKGRAHISLPLWIRHNDDLRATTIREGLRLQTKIDRSGDLVPGKIRTKWAIGIWE